MIAGSQCSWRTVAPYTTPASPRRLLMGRRGGYVMAGDVCVICSAPSGSSVINLANQTNPDINYSNLIADPSNLNAIFKHIQYFILPKYCLLCPIYAKSLVLPIYVFVGRFMRADTELDFCYAKIRERTASTRPRHHCIIDSDQSFPYFWVFISKNQLERQPTIYCKIIITNKINFIITYLFMLWPFS